LIPCRPEFAKGSWVIHSFEPGEKILTAIRRML
jgi:hypothetical protein